MKFGDTPKFFNSVKYGDATVVKLLYSLVFVDGSRLSRKKLLPFEGLGLDEDEVCEYAERLATDFRTNAVCAVCILIPDELAMRLSTALNAFDSVDSGNLTEDEQQEGESDSVLGADATDVTNVPNDTVAVGKVDSVRKLSTV